MDLPAVGAILNSPMHPVQFFSDISRTPFGLLGLCIIISIWIVFRFAVSFGSGFGRLIVALNAFDSSFVLSKPRKPPDKIKQSNSISFGFKTIAALGAILLLASFRGLIFESIHCGDASDSVSSFDSLNRKNERIQTTSCEDKYSQNNSKNASTRDAPTVDPYCACSVSGSSPTLARHSVPCPVEIFAEWVGIARLNRHEAKMSSIISATTRLPSTCFSEVHGGSIGQNNPASSVTRLNRHEAKMTSIAVTTSWLSIYFSEVQGGSNGQNNPASSSAMLNRHEAKMSSIISATKRLPSTCFSEVHGGSNGRNNPASSVSWFDSSVAVASDNDQASGVQPAPTAKFVGAQHFGSTESTHSASTVYSFGRSIAVALDFGHLTFDVKCFSDADCSASLVGPDLNSDLAPSSRDLYFRGCWLIVISGTDILLLPWLPYCERHKPHLALKLHLDYSAESQHAIESEFYSSSPPKQIAALILSSWPLANEGDCSAISSEYWISCREGDLEWMHLMHSPILSSFNVRKRDDCVQSTSTQSFPFRLLSSLSSSSCEARIPVLTCNANQAATKAKYKNTASVFSVGSRETRISQLHKSTNISQLQSLACEGKETLLSKPQSFFPNETSVCEGDAVSKPRLSFPIFTSVCEGDGTDRRTALFEQMAATKTKRVFSILAQIIAIFVVKVELARVECCIKSFSLNRVELVCAASSVSAQIVNIVIVFAAKAKLARVKSFDKLSQLLYLNSNRLVMIRLAKSYQSYAVAMVAATAASAATSALAATATSVNEGAAVAVSAFANEGANAAVLTLAMLTLAVRFQLKTSAAIEVAEDHREAAAASAATATTAAEAAAAASAAKAALAAVAATSAVLLHCFSIPSSKSAVATRIARCRCDAWISSATDTVHTIRAQLKCRWKIFCGGRSTARYLHRGTPY